MKRRLGRITRKSADFGKRHRWQQHRGRAFGFDRHRARDGIADLQLLRGLFYDLLDREAGRCDERVETLRRVGNESLERETRQLDCRRAGLRRIGRVGHRDLLARDGKRPGLLRKDREFVADTGIGDAVARLHLVDRAERPRHDVAQLKFRKNRW